MGFYSIFDRFKTKSIVAVVNNQQGKVVKEFNNLNEAYEFAGENGYQISVK